MWHMWVIPFNTHTRARVRAGTHAHVCVHACTHAKTPPPASSCVTTHHSPQGEALEIYVTVESANDGDEHADAMYFPAFMEALAEVR